MSWIMPNLLKTLRYRLMTLMDLHRWTLAAPDILRFRSLYEPHIGEESDDALKAAAGDEFTQMIATLGALSAEHVELLYAELGEEGDAVRSLVSPAAD